MPQAKYTGGSGRKDQWAGSVEFGNKSVVLGETVEVTEQEKAQLEGLTGHNFEFSADKSAPKER